MNWGRGRPLAVIGTKFDQNGVPTRSNVILDLTTKSYVDFDAWCVSADVYIQSFTNGLCLNVEHGNCPLRDEMDNFPSGLQEKPMGGV